MHLDLLGRGCHRDGCMRDRMDSGISVLFVSNAPAYRLPTYWVARPQLAVRDLPPLRHSSRSKRPRLLHLI